MKYRMLFLVFVQSFCLNSLLYAVEKLDVTRGLIDFKNQKYNSLLLANLAEPALFSIYRYGDAGHPNSKVRILLNIDGKLVEEELLEGGRKFSVLESEALVYLYGKKIRIFTDPPQYPKDLIVKGQYSNSVLDSFDLISPSWTLATKTNEHIKHTIVHLGTWKQPINIRVNFTTVETENVNVKDDLLCMIYIDGKPMVDVHGTPYLFSEGNSIDLTAKSLSIGFHPSVDNSLKGRIRGTFNIKKTDLE